LSKLSVLGHIGLVVARDKERINREKEEDEVRGLLPLKRRESERERGRERERDREREREREREK
jgi:hypothetical protein